MKNWNEYHDVTKAKPPRKNIIKFIEQYKITGDAIDIAAVLEMIRYI